MRIQRLWGLNILGFLLLSLSGIYAQPVSLELRAEPDIQKVNQQISFILRLTDVADAYFISLEAEYNADELEFLGEEAAGLTAGGLSISSEISRGVIGASATRTSPIVQPDSGDLIRLNFRISAGASPGSKSISFRNIVFRDQNGTLIDSNTEQSIDFAIQEDIGALSITGGPLFEATEGDSLILSVNVFSRSVTDQGGQEGRIRVWAGVNTSSTAPETWDESLWIPLSYSSQDAEEYVFSGDIAFGRPVGSYFVALRADLDQSGSYLYGGINGFWDDLTSPSAELNILQRGPYRYVLAEWDFENESLLSSAGSPANLDREIQLIGASVNGFNGGLIGSAVNSNGWNNFSEGEKYWLIRLNTENFESLQISSAMSGSNTGPRDFRIEVSTDSLTWTAVQGGEITVRNDNYGSGRVADLGLPAEAADQPEVFIRWLLTSDLRIDDSEGISSTGTNRLDEVIITGLNPNAARVAVWPGDTDNSGSVDAIDVLPLGIWWLSSGPLPIYEGIDWSGRETEAWIPEAATYADSDGSGLVDQNDLLAVGLNFGESRTAPKKLQDVVVSLSLPILKKGEGAEIYLHTTKEMLIGGWAARIGIDGPDPDQLTVETVLPPVQDQWNQEGKLITFRKQTGREWNLASVYKGRAPQNNDDEVLRLRIEAKKDWQVSPVLKLYDLKIRSGRQIIRPEGAAFTQGRITSIDGSPDVPEQTELLPNYPNPFNPVTTISFQLHQPGNAELKVFNALGQEVATLFSGYLQAGSYTQQLDAGGWASGMYVCELRAGEQRLLRKMMLVK